MAKKCYSAWKFKRELTVTNPSSTEGFQVKFDLTRYPGMAQDFRDIRFSDAKGNPVPYYRESNTSTSAVIWLKLPANLTKLYLYYGNGGAVSETSGDNVFDFYDGFSSLSSSKWTTVSGSPIVSGGALILYNTTSNEIVKSVSTFGTNTIFESRLYHAVGNRSEAGFFDVSTGKRVCWLGGVSASNNDCAFTDNGSYDTYFNDGTNRQGSTYYIYGCSYVTGGCKFWVNYELATTISTTIPSGNLPIVLYSEVNKGNVSVDWCRVRKYAAVEPTISVGRKYVLQKKEWPYFETIETSTALQTETIFQIKDFTNCSADLKTGLEYSFRYPNFYRVDAKGTYNKWKYKGDIAISNPPATEGTQVKVIIPRYPGMTLDGRDLRFSTTSGTTLNYYLESSTSDSFTVWVRLPASTSKINFYYGNGLAVSESNPETVFDFWDDFLSLDTEEWNITNGPPTVSDSIVTLSGTLNVSMISASTFSENTVFEAYGFHASGNQANLGYYASPLQASWLGAAGADTTDQYYTHDSGAGYTKTSDGVDRAGTVFYIYGIEYLTAGPKYYINYSYRNQVNTTLPTGAMSLLIYSAANMGDVCVDWVRIRKYTDASATVEKHYLQDSTVYIYYDPIEAATATGLSTSEPTYVTRRKLSDYSLISADLTKSINDTHLQLSARFADDNIPQENAIVKHYGYDKNGVSTLLFCGRVLSNTTTIGPFYKTVEMTASDETINLALQKIPWNYQTISLINPETGLANGYTWAVWIWRLIDYDATGCWIGRWNDSTMPSKQFVFEPSKSRLDAIKEICAYAGLMQSTRIWYRIDSEKGGIYTPFLYVMFPSEIDQVENGFDLPTPLTFSNPEDEDLVSEPTIERNLDEKYNKVTVYGTLTSTGETVVSSVQTAAVEDGEEHAKEYLVQDNSIEEKGSTAEIEAIKWLLYYATMRATVKFKLIKRYDLELYQRIKFSGTFPLALTSLTDTVQLPYVVAFDPRDETNSKHNVDVSGVPRPSWLRISELKYHWALTEEITEVTAITDFIYSSIDPVVPEPYNTYISAGYFKPALSDLVSSTESIVKSEIQNTLSSEYCTILSKSEDGTEAVVQTSSGKIVTVRLC